MLWFNLPMQVASLCSEKYSKKNWLSVERFATPQCFTLSFQTMFLMFKDFRKKEPMSNFLLAGNIKFYLNTCFALKLLMFECFIIISCFLLVILRFILISGANMFVKILKKYFRSAPKLSVINLLWFMFISEMTFSVWPHCTTIVRIMRCFQSC